MFDFLIIVHLIISILLIAVIILQRSSKDGLSGLGGGSNNINSILSAKTVAHALSKLTTYLIAAFLVNCIILGNLAIDRTHETIIDKFDSKATAEPAEGELINRNNAPQE